jgi:hypothetical protein
MQNALVFHMAGLFTDTNVEKFGDEEKPVAKKKSSKRM